MKKTKINFYDLAEAISCVAEHFGATKIEHLIEELHEHPELEVEIQQDGLLLEALINFEEG